VLRQRKRRTLTEVRADLELCDERGDDHLDALLCPIQAACAWQNRANGYTVPPIQSIRWKAGLQVQTWPNDQRVKKRRATATDATMKITKLWTSTDPQAWEHALERYWELIQPENLELERSLDNLELERLRHMDAQGWYDFLMNEYFRWKYTAPNRYATTTGRLRSYVEDNALGDLDKIHKRLLSLDPEDTYLGLQIASQIHGLGIAGASGLLALMYPRNFGTVDQFAVKALREVDELPEATDLERMKPEDLGIHDGELLINIFKRKAVENNDAFKSEAWTPRMVDKVLWTYGH